MEVDEFKRKTSGLATSERLYIILNEGAVLRIYNKLGEYITIAGKRFRISNDTLSYPIESVSAVTDEYLNLDSSWITFGSDPEFFFVRDGIVVPSNLVIHGKSKDDLVICDGFQGELNPIQNTCREVSGYAIKRSLFRAFGYARNAGATISFNVCHEISPEVWKDTPLMQRRFGCNPSKNVYKNVKRLPTGLGIKMRSASGHIHLGSHLINRLDDEQFDNLVKVLDIVVGNTCVLVDRDPANALRRKYYGRAGEYRKKGYGIEYRVLSNFWLRGYQLWSFVSALCRNAVSIQSAGKSTELINLFDMSDVQNAINDNNYELALRNFLILKDFLISNTAVGSGLSHYRIEGAEKWMTSKNPLEQWDSEEKTVESWRISSDGGGFERMIDRNYCL